METTSQPEKIFYEYQQKDIEVIFNMMNTETNFKLLYQLPTGGGKTVVFSEIARRFIELILVIMYNVLERGKHR